MTKQTVIALTATVISLFILGCQKQNPPSSLTSSTSAAPATTAEVSPPAKPITDIQGFQSYLMGTTWCAEGNVVQGMTDLLKIKFDKTGKHYTYYYRMGAYSSGWGDGESGRVKYGTDRDVNTGEYFTYAQLGDTALVLVKELPATMDGNIQVEDGPNPVLDGYQNCDTYE